MRKTMIITLCALIWGADYAEAKGGGRGGGSTSTKSSSSFSKSTSSTSTKASRRLSLSPAQFSAKKVKWETEGYNDGYAKAYTGKTKTEINDFEDFEDEYDEAFKKGVAEGLAKLEADKITAHSQGYERGLVQDDGNMPAEYAENEQLNKAYNDGLAKGTTERDEKYKKEYAEKGYNDGKADKKEAPSAVKQMYANAYEEGYAKGYGELRSSYYDKGHDEAFVQPIFQDPGIANEKYASWYKEGFYSNTSVELIKTEAFENGRDGKAGLPDEYKHAQPLYQYHFDLGQQKRKEDQRALAVGLGGVLVSWLGRRFYVAQKIIRWKGNA